MILDILMTKYGVYVHEVLVLVYVLFDVFLDNKKLKTNKTEN